MIKRSLILLLLLVFTCLFASLVNAGQVNDNTAMLKPGDIIDQMMQEISLEKVDHVASGLIPDTEKLLPMINFSQMVKKFIKDGLKFDWNKFLSSIWQTFFREILFNSALMGQLLILGIFAALLKNFQDAFNKDGINQVSNGIIYLVLVVIALNSFSTASQIGLKAINDMVNFMYALLPMLFTLLVSIGAVSSAGIFQPLIFFIVSLISTVIKTFVFPLVFLAVILSVVSSFTGEFRLSRLGGFIKQMGITILGLSFVIFFGVITIQGAAVSVADGLSLRTAKYLTSTFVPIMGGAFANAIDLVVGCSLLIQNGVGLVGMLFIFITVAFPIIKILAVVLIYKLVSAIIQPICDSMIVECMNNLGNSLMLIFVSVTAVAIMFFIFITITIGIANITVMLR